MPDGEEAAVDTTRCKRAPSATLRQTESCTTASAPAVVRCAGAFMMTNRNIDGPSVVRRQRSAPARRTRSDGCAAVWARCSSPAERPGRRGERPVRCP
ncbi:MAG: hypothetical protein D6725_07075 [Planctomycetota bacterium]|nr:MAG: hypothetical protein D6725_07075 [Planctomycetota bacterium]